MKLTSSIYKNIRPRPEPFEKLDSKNLLSSCREFIRICRQKTFVKLDPRTKI